MLFNREPRAFRRLWRVVHVDMLGEVAIEQGADAWRGAERLAIVDGIGALADRRQRRERRRARPVHGHHAEPSESEPALAAGLIAIFDDERAHAARQGDQPEAF